MRTLSGFLLTLGLAGLLACGGGSGYGSSTAGGSGTVNVTLVDGPIANFKSLFLNIIRVEISQDGSAWTTLSTPTAGPVDLLTLTGGVSQALATGVTLPAGSYGQMRLILGPGNTIVLADNTSHALTVPSGMQSGIKLTGPFTVQAGTTGDIFIDFDAAHSIQVVQTGASNKYMLRPTVRAFEQAVTGSITGVFTDQAGGAPLAGVAVLAETLDGAGNPAVVRHVTTGADGRYTLNLLPVGATYFVVSLPATATAVYAPAASAGFNLTAAAPTFTYSAAFTAAASTGTLDGTVTPVAGADQSDLVNLLASLTPAGAASAATFIVGWDMAAVGTGSETFTLGTLPVGPYTLAGVRSTLNLDGSTTVTTATPVPVTVAAGANTAVVAF